MSNSLPPPSSFQKASEYIDTKRAHDAESRKINALQSWIAVSEVNDNFEEKFKEENNQTRAQLLTFALTLKRADIASKLIDLVESLPPQFFIASVVKAVEIGDIALIQKLMEKFTSNPFAPNPNPFEDLNFINYARDLSKEKKQEIKKILIQYVSPNVGLIAAFSLNWTSKISELIPKIEPNKKTFVECIRSGTLEHIQLYLSHTLSNELLISGLPHALSPDKRPFIDLIFNRLNMDEPISKNAQFDLEATYQNAAVQDVLFVLEKIDHWVSEVTRANACLATIGRGHYQSFRFIFDRYLTHPIDLPENPLAVATQGNHALILQDLIDSNLFSSSKLVHRALFDAVSFGHLESLQILSRATDLSSWDKEDLDMLTNSKRLENFYGVDHTLVVGFVQSELEKKALNLSLPLSSEKNDLNPTVKLRL